ncbi:hypothetical protein [Adlercreutzia sp. ZJ138]|uniref:hypothetical protein n=1 Tax=Adlercreutzia sp. ZJ138 TaxID=2709405 RepID=UPI0013EC6A8E|nr:hypothetical protein [Adlercreutzia sp. ZJ138]
MADIFRSQVRFYGKHGQYLEALTPGTENAKNLDLPEIERNKYLFDTVVDIYIIAPIVGYLFQRRAPRDGGDSNKNIMEGALASHHDKLVFSYELLMILDKQSEPDINERIRRAFRANDELTAQGMSVYNDYARGGIEVLYEKLVTGAATPEDLLRNLMDFTEEWNEKFIEETSELNLDELLHR